MNADAIEYIRDKMGYEDVVIQVITYKTWCDPPRPELSVSFIDGGDKYCENEDYIVEDSSIGKVFIPKNDIDIVGDIGIRYEKHPWIEQFEFDGLQPRIPVRTGFGLKRAKGFAESLGKIYASAFVDYAEMCSETFINSENEDGLDCEVYFSKAASFFAQNADKPEKTPMLRKFCGFTENMWREGTEAMHDIALKTILPIIESNPEAKKIFYNTITSEFREYIKENGYSGHKSC